jgi:hypothetical protein
MHSEIPKLYNRNDIPKFLEKYYKNGVGIELGVALGQYLVELATDWTSGRIYGIDCWEQQDTSVYNDPLNIPTIGNWYSHVQQRIQPFKDRVRIYKTYTTEAVKSFPDNYFDFIYIDANHSYEAALKDIELYYPKLKKGGLFGGHDYGEVSESVNVKKAVDEFFPGRTIHVMPCSSWFLLD